MSGTKLIICLTLVAICVTMTTARPHRGPNRGKKQNDLLKFACEITNTSLALDVSTTTKDCGCVDELEEPRPCTWGPREVTGQFGESLSLMFCDMSHLQVQLPGALRRACRVEDASNNIPLFPERPCEGRDAEMLPCDTSADPFQANIFNINVNAFFCPPPPTQEEDESHSSSVDEDEDEEDRCIHTTLREHSSSEDSSRQDDFMAIFHHGKRSDNILQFACEITNTSSGSVEVRDCGCLGEELRTCSWGPLEVTGRFGESLSLKFCDMSHLQVQLPGALRHACRVEDASNNVALFPERQCKGPDSEIIPCDTSAADPFQANIFNINVNAFFCPPPPTQDEEISRRHDDDEAETCIHTAPGEHSGGKGKSSKRHMSGEPNGNQPDQPERGASINASQGTRNSRGNGKRRRSNEGTVAGTEVADTNNQQRRSGTVTRTEDVNDNNQRRRSPVGISRRGGRQGGRN